MRDIILILHDIRSTHNVGSILRTAECFGIRKIYFSGYTPYPHTSDDTRLPHVSRKLSKQIHKTALGTEELLEWQHIDDIYKLIKYLKEKQYVLVGLEQDSTSVPLPTYTPKNKIAIIIGREVEGIDSTILKLCDDIVEIPLYGKKESLNVAQATAVALYVLRES